MNTGTACTVLALSSAMLVAASDLSTYRGLTLGETTVDAAVRHIGAAAKDVRTVHNRPALIQELDWSPRYTARHDAKDPDPVREHVLRFYNGKLFQVVSAYARERVEGMTEADLIEVISRTYGTASTPGGEIPYRSNYGEAATVMALWENSEHSAALVRSPDGSSFALLLTTTALDTTARAAIAEARRLDDLDAPRRAIEQKNRQATDEREVLEKARSANKPNFRP